MSRVVQRLLVLALVVCAFSNSAFAQGSGTTSLSGVVTDTGGGVIPGATVVVKNDATGVTYETVSSSTGAFSVPSLDPGTYTATVSLSGFKTSVISNIRLLTATPASIDVKLDVGALTETVEVRASSTLVQTQSSAVTSTMAVEQLKQLPLVSRNALYSLAFLPGVETAGGPRGAVISGLPNNTVNITIDGISTGNQFQNTDGFFSMVTPRLDAIEEITVTGATPGAGSGNGSTQVAFTTRSGTNEFNGSVYDTIRDPRLNSNYYFNRINGLQKNQVKLQTYGGRLGGPIVIPGLYDGHNKAFFFFNMEHQYQPSSATRTRTILNPDAQNGLFAYTSGGQTRTVNLYTLAAANGQTATPDPFILNLLGQIRQSTTTTGSVTTPAGQTNLQNFVYQATSSNNQYAPTTRIDYNLTDNHRLGGSYLFQRFLSKPDLLNNAEPPFPGFPNQGFQTSWRTVGSLWMRSTLSSKMVNELRGGWQTSPNNFFGNISRDMFDYQGGFLLNFPTITDPGANNNPAPRNTPNYNIEDTLSLQRGSHSFSLGGSYQRTEHRQNSKNLVPQLDFGVDQTFDPANAMFTTANFPGASNNVLTEARNIYAILTGRITSVTGTARLDANTNKYVYLGNLYQVARMDSFDLFAQDSWRMTPTFTVNYGVRYDVQLPFSPVTRTWSTSTLADLCGRSGVGNGPAGRSCNLFQPGINPAGAVNAPTYLLFEPGSHAVPTDWNNVGPNAGVAWRPNVQGGWLRTLLGDPEQATLRGGYSMTFGLERMQRFTDIYGGNPGGTTVASRNYTTGFPIGTAPLLFREQNRLGPPAFSTEPVYPLLATAANNLNIFDPNIKTPYVHQFSAGFQRSIGRDMALEVRYVGNRNKNAWTTENWNAEENIFETGFLNEFKLAQQNIAANVAAGRGATFRYFGPGTGTSPLPIYLAYFSGVPASQAGDPARYTSANFSNTAWTGHLSTYEADPQDAANDLHANTTFRGNAISAGLPANFFVMNPAVNAAQITRSLAGTKYDSLQVDLRRRFSRGFLINMNYTFAKRQGSSLQSLRQERIYLEDTQVPHAFKTQWTWQIPVGRDRRFGTGMNSALNAILGNWEFSGTGRLQRQLFDLGSVKLFGMTKDELQKAFKIRTVRSDAGTITVFNFPQDIVDNTRRAFNTDAGSATGYGGDGPPTGRYIGPASDANCIALYAGDCGAAKQVLLLGPVFSRWDMRLNKRFPFGPKTSFELGFEVLNVFDNINFNYATNPSPNTSADTFRVTSAYTDINTTFDPGGRIGQLVLRFSW
ncbi:MAG TPA: TonB-dependent receptor [Vicinamibacterales bacterium]|nr:TonB-dependent receptor [Vicinamibacterales bacterium]